MEKIVVYKDEMNTVPLRSFNSKEMDLFFSICSKMRNKGLDKITFSFEELRELSDYKYTAHDRFIKDIESVYDKLLKLDIKLGSSKEFTKFVLFTKYSVSASNEIVEIKINEEFKDILNNIAGNFTKFELMEFTALESSYSKTVYRLLKQYRSTGYYIVQIDEFRRLLDIPNSYKMGNIDQRVLHPIKLELPHYFENLQINKIKGKGKRKRYIEHIEFKFKPQTDIKNGKKIFRDKESGEFYEKEIMDFDREEVEKTYPEAKPLSENINKRKSLGLPMGIFTNKEVDEIYDLACNILIEKGSNISLFDFVGYYWESIESKKDIRKKSAYLKNLLKNDYDNRLGQQSLF